MSFLLSAQSVFAGNSAEEAFELGMARFDQGDYELAIPISTKRSSSIQNCQMRTNISDVR